MRNSVSSSLVLGASTSLQFLFFLTLRFSLCAFGFIFSLFLFFLLSLVQMAEPFDLFSLFPDCNGFSGSNFFRVTTLLGSWPDRVHCIIYLQFSVTLRIHSSSVLDRKCSFSSKFFDSFVFAEILMLPHRALCALFRYLRNGHSFFVEFITFPNRQV